MATNAASGSGTRITVMPLADTETGTTAAKGLGAVKRLDVFLILNKRDVPRPGVLQGSGGLDEKGIVAKHLSVNQFRQLSDRGIHARTLSSLKVAADIGDCRHRRKL